MQCLCFSHGRHGNHTICAAVSGRNPLEKKWMKSDPLHVKIHVICFFILYICNQINVLSPQKKLGIFSVSGQMEVSITAVKKNLFCLCKFNFPVKQHFSNCSNLSFTGVKCRCLLFLPSPPLCHPSDGQACLSPFVLPPLRTLVQISPSLLFHLDRKQSPQ